MCHGGCLPLLDLRGGVRFCSCGSLCSAPSAPVQSQRSDAELGSIAAKWQVGRGGGWGEVGGSSAVYRIFGNVVKSFSGWRYLLLAGIDDVFVIY